MAASPNFPVPAMIPATAATRAGQVGSTLEEVKGGYESR